MRVTKLSDYYSGDLRRAIAEVEALPDGERVALAPCATMRVLETFMIKGRGPMVCVEPVAPRPVNGATLRRASDAKTWTVAGTEHNARGWNGGILVSGDAIPALAAGDEIELLPQNENDPSTNEG